MYIMANNGNQIDNAKYALTNLRVAEGALFKRFYIQSSVSTLRITVKASQPNIIDVIHNFKPDTVSLTDYFMRVSSNVKSDTLYHDSNGFLVSKRPLNARPDYDFIINPQDRINSNTYPTCSFAYLLNDTKKIVFFTDRATGVASYNQDLLINFDRLTLDDGKGVSENYNQLINNTWRYKFAIVTADDHIERVWQREYDEGMLGFISEGTYSSIKYRQASEPPGPTIPAVSTNLKYTLFYLNDNEFVLRLQNLAEMGNLIIPSFSPNGNNYIWSIENVGLWL
jgi:hypothetical protein